ncbi:MAG: acyl-CoA thioester hydrolase [Arenicella sp.]|jgi:acyl-CoA thioester hydrolase
MISCPLQIRFSDCDIAGHIHNAVYLQYFESGRMHFLVSQLGREWDWKKYGVILKKNEVIYHRPGKLENQLSVEVSCSYIGTKSFTLTYEIKDENGALVAEGSSVLVCFDYIQNKVVEIHSSFQPILQKHFSARTEA